MIPNVLVAEDRSEESRQCVQALNRFKIRVRVAESFEEARERLSKEQFDCLWMDLNFTRDLDPDFQSDKVKDGIDLIASAEASVPALVCSAFSQQPEAHAKAKRLGADSRIAGWYPKPYDADVIAFETVRVVDMRNWKLLFEAYEGELASVSTEEAAVQKNFWRTEQPVTRMVHRDKRMLTRKLVQLLEEMTTLLMQKNELRGLDTYVKNFRLLVVNHLNVFLRFARRPYKVLADDIVFLVARQNIGNNLDLDITRGLIRAIECLERDDLSDEEVFDVKSDLEALSRRPLGAVLGSSEGAVMQYLADLKSEDGNL